MAALFRRIVPLLALVGLVRAAPPAGLATALEYLRDQRSYSWEIINADPGPVALQFETRRGTVTSVQQNTAPHVRGQIDRRGDMRIEREWADGLRLVTVIRADGSMITETPEGWMTDREILTAQAEERLRSTTPTPRALWLRRADRPDVRRPDQELVPFLQTGGPFEFNGDSYTARIRSRSGDPAQPNPDEDEPSIDVTVVMNVKNGIIRDYEVKIEAVRRVARSRVQIPISEQRIVILTYVPINRIDVPEAALAKLPPTNRN
jgi:hypothetical protein